MSKVTPSLRFKEYKDKWTENSFGKVSEFINGKAYTQSELLDKGKYRVLRVGNLFSRNEWYYSDLELEKDKYIEAGDLIYAWSASFGPRFWREEKVIYHYHIWKVIPNEAIVDRLFLFHVLASDVDRIKAVSQGGTMVHITKGSIESRMLKLPLLPEQQKIASFLSAVDEKIQQLTRKKELLEQYKKGVMQQLFRLNHDSSDLRDSPDVKVNQGNQKNHHQSQFRPLRFKDENGKDYPKWEEKRLGEVGNIISGLTYSPNDIHENGVLVLRSSNVQDRRLTFDDNVYVNVSPSDFNPVMENDILICVRNGSKNLIGKNALIDKKNIGIAFGAFMTVYRSDFNCYLFHYFDTDNYKNEVHKNLGATINSINGSDLKKFKVPFPSNDEQRKIANFLSAIDTKIETVTNQITQTQTFKKGLLQQMFV